MLWLNSGQAKTPSSQICSCGKYELEREESHAKLNLSYHCELTTLEYQKRYLQYKKFIEMNLRLIKANMHETFLHFSKYILSEKGKIERSNCECKV